MDNFKRYKITEIPEIRYAMGGQPYTVFREVRLITGWARFGHYIIDYLLLQGLAFVTGLFIGLANPEFASTDPDENLSNQLILTGVGVLVNLLFYSLFEGFFGSTPGKMMLGRLVIDEYGLRPEPQKIFLRSLARLVPFEAFSCLADRGWHDRWTGTYVVHKDEANHLWELLSQVDRDTAQRDSEEFRSHQGPEV